MFPLRTNYVAERTNALNLNLSGSGCITFLQTSEASSHNVSSLVPHGQLEIVSAHLIHRDARLHELMQ